MLDPYSLPEQVTFEGRTYGLCADFRQILKIFGVLEDNSMPMALRWRVAAKLFYTPSLAPEDYEAGLRYLGEFLTCGQPAAPGPKLIDWQVDAPAIIAGVNRVAGQEIRSLPFVHWWSFLGWFHAIGEGELSSLVILRDKLNKGKKLEGWEQEFFRENRERVILRPKLTPQEQAEKDRLIALLNGTVPEEPEQAKG